MEPPRLYCIIVTYKRHIGLARSIAFANAQVRPPDRIVVVDNERSSEVRRVVEESTTESVPIVLLEAPENLGPAGGTALAMESILSEAHDQDWITRLDDDLDESIDVFAELLRFAVEQRALDPTVGAVGAVGARYDWATGRLIRIGDDEIDAGPVDVDYVPTNVFPAFNVGVVRTVGVFDSALFYGSSEVEYGLRMRNAGFRLVADPLLWKMVGRRSADSAGPRVGLRPFTWRRYYSLRNQVYLLRTNGHPAAALRVGLVRGIAKPLLNIPRQPRLASRYLWWNTRAVVDGWRGRLGRTIDPENFTKSSSHHV